MRGGFLSHDLRRRSRALLLSAATAIQGLFNDLKGQIVLPVASIVERVDSTVQHVGQNLAALPIAKIVVALVLQRFKALF